MLKRAWNRFARPPRDMTRETLVYPPHGRTARSSKVIFVIFFAVMIFIVTFALYITFNTDSRQEAANLVTTETAEIRDTAAAHSTQTAAARGVTDASPTVPVFTATGTPVATPAP